MVKTLCLLPWAMLLLWQAASAGEAPCPDVAVVVFRHHPGMLDTEERMKACKQDEKLIRKALKDHHIGFSYTGGLGSGYKLSVPGRHLEDWRNAIDKLLKDGQLKYYDRWGLNRRGFGLVSLTDEKETPLLKIALAYPDALPRVVEELAAAPAMTQIIGTDGVEAITCASYRGCAEIYVRGKPNVDVATLTRLIEGRLQLARPVLPAAAKILHVSDVSGQAILLPERGGEIPCQTTDIDREKANHLGVAFEAALDAVALATRQKQPLAEVTVPAARGAAVPLREFASVATVYVPDHLVRRWPVTDDDEAREIRRLEERAKAFEQPLSGALWFLIHTADEKHKAEAFRAIHSVEQFDENEQCDLPKAIHRAGGVAGYRRHITALLRNDDVSVRANGAVLLGVIGDQNSAPDLIALVRAKDLPVQESVFTGADRGRAAMALGMLGAKPYTAELAALLRDDNAHLRAGAATALGHLGAKEHAAQIAALLDDEDAQPIFAALAALGELGAKQYVQQIAGLLRRPARDVSIPDAALSALMQLDAKEQADKIAAFLVDEHSGAAGTAAQALAVLGERQYVKDIAGLLKGGDDAGAVLARRDALLALGILQAKEYAAEVAVCLKDKEGMVRRAAAWSLVLMEDAAHRDDAVRVLEKEASGEAIGFSSDNLKYVPAATSKEIQRRAEDLLRRGKR